jgi:hypothetical protein
MQKSGKQEMARRTRTPEQARQARVALTTPSRRAVFFGGLAAAAALAILAALH